MVKIGEEFRVKVVEIDEQGRVNLSKKRVDGVARKEDKGQRESPAHERKAEV